MKIYELYMVNDDWNEDTVLRILNRDRSLYKNVSMSEISKQDIALEILGFSKNEIIVDRKRIH